MLRTHSETTSESIVTDFYNSISKNSYYTLVWKDFNGIANIKSFISFEDLKIYVKEYIKNGLIKNLKALDEEKTIYYLKEIKQ